MDSLKKYNFKDDHGHPLENCQGYIDLLSRAEAAEAKLQAYESHGPDGHNVTNAQHQAVADKLRQAEGALRRLKEGIEELVDYGKANKAILSSAYWIGGLEGAVHDIDAALSTTTTPQPKVRIA